MARWLSRAVTGSLSAASSAAWGRRAFSSAVPTSLPILRSISHSVGSTLESQRGVELACALRDAVLQLLVQAGQLFGQMAVLPERKHLPHHHQNHQTQTDKEGASAEAFAIPVLETDDDQEGGSGCQVGSQQF